MNGCSEPGVPPCGPNDCCEGTDDCGDCCVPNGICDPGENSCTCPEDCCPEDCPQPAARDTGARPTVSGVSGTLAPVPEDTPVQAVTIRLGSASTEAGARLEKFIQYQNVESSGFFTDLEGGRVADDIHDDPTLPPSIITDITFRYCVFGSNPSATWPASSQSASAPPWAPTAGR
ncbi:MAG: hypothetical protein IH959_10080 [Chloroflexi bacterium]|nr:hypothetical protein [Chloroflexota bacterium]